MDAIKKTGYENEVKIGMDVAASEFLLPSGKFVIHLIFVLHLMKPNLHH